MDPSYRLQNNLQHTQCFKSPAATAFYRFKNMWKFLNFLECVLMNLNQLFPIYRFDQNA